ncbi:HAD-IA family hydrolase [Fructobacillus sp. M2-14]|uniref:HAD-IA family hydrolase n=1 Tax=Fructobacillus broussonetiae TaxID=2713173 RepID=A0ABS5QYL8_9LACO|nr:HAD-IA family hydrolase [Fructobacillus broussonetiae]MBS9338077.1 HAD-IA family hydrolase [Fructobacillus broussonetiae]
MQNFIFDFDGTLANSGKTGVLATQAAFKEEGYAAPSEEDINYYMGIPIEVSFKKMLPSAVSESDFDRLLETFRKHYRSLEAENLVLFPRIMETLEELVSEEKKLYVVSSKHSTALLRNLETLGINQLFTKVIGSDHVEHFKPAPDGVLAVIESGHLNKDDSIMIGDAIFDLQMGKSAGVHTGAVAWGAHDVKALKSEQPDYVFEDAKDWLNI